MSQGQGGPPDDTGNGNSGGGPPERFRERIAGTRRDAEGDIVVSDDPLEQLANDVDWDNLSPFEEYVLAVMERKGLLE